MMKTSQVKSLMKKTLWNVICLVKKMGWTLICLMKKIKIWEKIMSYQASLISLTSSSSSSSLEDSDNDQDYVMITKYFRSSIEYVDKHYFKQL